MTQKSFFKEQYIKFKLGHHDANQILITVTYFNFCDPQLGFFYTTSEFSSCTSILFNLVFN